MGVAKYYAFRFDGSSWQEEELLVASMAATAVFSAQPGTVALSDRTAFVGAFASDIAYVFTTLLVDCNLNGLHDPDEVDAGTAFDCDLNGVLDECDIIAGALDCNGNGIPDVCDLITGATDCNMNGILDECDLAGGANPDPVPPTWSGNPGDQLISIDAGTCFAAAFWTAPTPFDDCILVDAFSSHLSGDTFPLGITVVTYTAIDLGGNSTDLQFSIEVVDDESPTLAGVPTDLTVVNDSGQCGAVVTWAEPTENDNCPGASLSGDATPGDFFPVGESMVTYTATDAAGNDASVSFSVTVTDSESPVVTPSADVIVPADPTLCGANVAVPAPMLSDNCPGVTVTNDFTGTDDASALYPVGDTTVTWIATDAAGNTSMAIQLVTIEVDPTDCNGNGTPDACDIASGMSLDTNGNDIPDECEPHYVRGDSNGDEAIDIGDAIFTLNYLFNGGDEPGCFDSGDANDDLAVDIADSAYVLGFLFNNGPPPPPPFGACGVSPNASLGCEETTCP